jgi:hypothetical protein
MEITTPSERLSEIALEILAYMTDHPQASDSSEGIIRWWLLERRIERGMVRVEAAIEELVASGLILATEGPGARRRYRLNPETALRVRELVAHAEGRA